LWGLDEAGMTEMNRRQALWMPRFDAALQNKHLRRGENHGIFLVVLARSPAQS